MIQVGTRKQLLLDDFALESPGGPVRVFHKFKKDPSNPVLEQQFPWEYAGVQVYQTAVYYDQGTGRIRLYYTSSQSNPVIRWVPGPKPGGFWHDHQGYGRSQMIALSEDGIHWTRPNIGLIETNGTKANNLIGLAEQIVQLHQPYQDRYRYACYTAQTESWKTNVRIQPKERFFLSVSFSPDGIGNWTDFRPVAPNMGDVATVAPDDLGGGYLGFAKWRTSWWLGKSFGEEHNTRKILKLPGFGGRSFAPEHGQDPVTCSRGPLNVDPSAEDDRRSFRYVAEAFPGIDFLSAEEIHREVYVLSIFSSMKACYFAPLFGPHRSAGLAE